jgi:uncharacterized protein YndB with AHSA1/START domain
MMSLAELMRIDRSIDIEASPERVWRALTDAEHLSAWFQVRIEGDIATGSAVWMTSTTPDQVGQRFRVRFMELTPPRRLVWRWHPGAVDPAVDYSREPETVVTFILEAAGSGTKLSVSETGFDEVSLARRAKVYEDNNQGWAEVLVWLQEHVEAKS